MTTDIRTGLTAAEADVTAARDNVANLIKSATAAKFRVDMAKSDRARIVDGAVNGDTPATTAIRACHDAVAATEIEHAYWLDVQAAAETILSAKLAAQDHQRMLFERARIQALHDAVDAEYRAFYPEQPSDDALKAELLKNPSLLSQVMAEATRTYDKAYHFWVGNAANPMQPPRGRIIEEWNDCRAVLQWAAAIPQDQPMGWQARNTIRQIRVYLAISAHFANYVTLDVDACRRMHEHYSNVYAGYQVARQRLPRWVRTGAIAPNTFVPIEA